MTPLVEVGAALWTAIRRRTIWACYGNTWRRTAEWSMSIRIATPCSRCRRVPVRAARNSQTFCFQCRRSVPRQTEIIARRCSNSRRALPAVSNGGRRATMTVPDPKLDRLLEPPLSKPDSSAFAIAARNGSLNHMITASTKESSSCWLGRPQEPVAASAQLAFIGSRSDHECRIALPDLSRRPTHTLWKTHYEWEELFIRIKSRH
jgi:hypothetical protein